MLIYYFIFILILSSGMGLYIYHNYAYRIFDSRYDIPVRSSFDYQNCQIDGSCRNAFSKDPSVPPMPNLRPPFMGKNRLCLKSTYVPIQLPKLFFNKNYTSNIFS